MSPSPHSRTNASRTAREYASSSVKRVRLQSQEQPITLSCSRMVSPVSRMNAHTRSTNCSRPRSNRVFPSLATSRSTTFWVAIPAWSVPGSHSASRPRIRSKRINTSWITLLRPCPVWRIAVMLGGGMTITYGSRDESARAVNTPCSCQRRYSGASTSCGSYCGGGAEFGRGHPFYTGEDFPPDGIKVAILTDKDPQALDVLRHSSAHVLATAVRQLFPHAQIGFGPSIEDGFYYDFAVPTPFTPEDLARIEAKMHEVVKADYPFVREEVNREEAKRRFIDDPLKLERIDDLGANEVISDRKSVV